MATTPNSEEVATAHQTVEDAVYKALMKYQSNTDAQARITFTPFETEEYFFLIL